MSEQSRDTTDPGYPGTTAPVIPQPGDLDPSQQGVPPMPYGPPPDGGQDPTITQMPLSDQAAQAQAMIGPPPARAQGGTLAMAREIGFSPEAIAIWAAMQNQPAA